MYNRINGNRIRIPNTDNRHDLLMFVKELNCYCIGIPQGEVVDNCIYQTVVKNKQPNQTVVVYTLTKPLSQLKEGKDYIFKTVRASDGPQCEINVRLWHSEDFHPDKFPDINKEWKRLRLLNYNKWMKILKL